MRARSIVAPYPRSNIMTNLPTTPTTDQPAVERLLTAARLLTSSELPSCTNDAALRSELTVALVFLAYGDSYGLPVRSLEFSTEPLTDLETIRRCLDAIGDYNDFNPDDVADAVASVFADIVSVAIGRAGSPLLAIEVHAGDAAGVEARSLRCLLALSMCKPDDLSIGVDNHQRGLVVIPADVLRIDELATTRINAWWN